MTVTIERCDGRTRADAIRDLFLRNDRPDFPAVQERAYRWWMERGAASWVGLDEAGRVVLHVAAFPRDFGRNGDRLRGAVLGDLMADTAHRNFWSPVQLLRTAVDDIAARDAVDFLISDPTPLSAGIMRAAGFKPLGAMRRLMLPLSRPYLMFSRMRSRAKALDVEGLALGDARVDDLLGRVRGAGFRVARTSGVVATRVPGGEFGDGSWIAMSAHGQPVALALVSTLVPLLARTIVDVVWDADQVALASVVHAIARDAREHGYRRLSATVLEGSRSAADLLRAGFLTRADAQPFVVRTLKPGLTLPRLEDWWLSPLDGSAW